jgi:hypothetical protein
MSLDSLIVNQIANSYKLLKAASATITRTTLGAIDPSTGEPSTTATQSYSTRCKLDATSLKTLGFRFGDGLVQGGDIQISIPAKGVSFAPRAGDTATTKSVVYVVIDVRPSYAPGGAETEYNCLVRL